MTQRECEAADPLCRVAGLPDSDSVIGIDAHSLRGPGLASQDGAGCQILGPSADR